MDTLHRQVRRARQRLTLQLLAGELARYWCAALWLAAAVIAAGKLWGAFGDRSGALAIAACGLAGGAILAAVWTWRRRPSALAAAGEMDGRFALNERVSSALALDGEQLASPMGAALVADAERRLDRIDVAERFDVRVDRRGALALLPAAAACMLAVFVAARTVESPGDSAKADTPGANKPAESLVKKLKDQRREAAAKGLEEADLVLARLEAAAKSLAEKAPDRKHSLVALNDLAGDAEKRRRQLAGGNALKRQLARLKNLEHGPAERLARALKAGDVTGALGELERLKRQLADNKLDPQAREALARQLAQVGDALAKQTQAHSQAQRELGEQIAAQRRAGNVEAAERLEQQLQRLAQKAPQMDKLGQMQQQLGQAAAAIQSGEAKRASQALGQLGAQLEDMLREGEELEMLDAALAQVADCKHAIACQECDGEGCVACQGDAAKPGKASSRALPPGRGVAAAGQKGQQPHARFYDSQVKSEVGRGPSVVIGQAEGQNRKGQVQEQIKLEFSAADQRAADALSNQRLPREYREHAKNYFDTLREGRR